MLEQVAVVFLLQRVDVALEHRLPEVADVRHVDQHEGGLSELRLISEPAEEMGLPRSAAADQDPSQRRLHLARFEDGFQLLDELLTGWSMQGGDVPGRIAPDLGERHGPVEVETAHDIQWVHDGFPPR